MPLLEASNPTPEPAASDAVFGQWRLLWTQQAAGASPLQQWGSKQARNYQVIRKDGTLENVVDLGAVQARKTGTQMWTGWGDGQTEG